MEHIEKLTRLLRAYDFTHSDVAQVAEERDLKQYKACMKYTGLSKQHELEPATLVAQLVSSKEFCIADALILLNATNRGMDALITRQLDDALLRCASANYLATLCGTALQLHSKDLTNGALTFLNSVVTYNQIIKSHKFRLSDLVAANAELSRPSVVMALMKKQKVYLRASSLAAQRVERLSQLRQDFRSLWLAFVGDKF